ncbi:MAG: hypothetical protein ACKOU7_10070 [Ferruginibacter sp.]
MKIYALSVVLGLMILATAPSCLHISDHDVSVTVSDDEDEYEMDADYSRSKSHAVRVYLNDHLLDGKIRIKHNDYVDKEITLDDNTTFYINAHPGRLQIKIDKTENSEAQCERVRLACEDLKEILAAH